MAELNLVQVKSDNMDESSSEQLKEEAVVETPEKYTLGITLLDYDKYNLAIEMIRRHF